jgi:membrane-associated phospholipid phosphatase
MNTVEPPSDLLERDDTRQGTATSPRGRDLAAAFVKAKPALDARATGRAGERQSRVVRWLLLAMFLLYVGGAVAYFIWRGQSFRPDAWALLLLVAALVMGRAGPFLRDWIPFVLLVFGYEFLRGVAGEYVTGGRRVGDRERWELPQVQVESLIAFDKVLFFGHEPVSTIQGWLFTPGRPQWWDFLAIIVYTMHFAVPCVFAFLLWIKRKAWFWQFTLTFCLMTYSAFIAFLLFPAAPPWLANSWGVVSGIGWPASSVTAEIGFAPIREFDTLSIFQNASPHPVAAFPSLHAAFPWLVLLFAVRCFGRRGLWMLLYNAALWFSVVYLANHWVVDILAGIAWATVAFITVDVVWRYMAEHQDDWLPAPLRTGIVNVTHPVTSVLGPVWNAPGRLRAWVKHRIHPANE